MPLNGDSKCRYNNSSSQDPPHFPSPWGPSSARTFQWLLMLSRLPWPEASPGDQAGLCCSSVVVTSREGWGHWALPQLAPPCQHSRFPSAAQRFVGWTLSHRGSWEPSRIRHLISAVPFPFLRATFVTFGILSGF